MSTMAHQTVTSAAFVAVAPSTVRAFIQLKTAGAVVIRVASSLPAADSIVGVVLESGEAEEISFDNLEAGDVIYARALSDDPVTLLVMSSDSVPT